MCWKYISDNNKQQSMALYIKLPDNGLVETVVNATTNEWDHSNEGFCQNSSASCHSAWSKCHTSKTGEGDEYMLGCQSFMMRLRLIWSYYYCLASCFSVLYVGIYVWQNCIYTCTNHRMHSTICWLHGYQPALLTIHLLMSRASLQSPTSKKLKSSWRRQERRFKRANTWGRPGVFLMTQVKCELWSVNIGNMMQPQLQV